MAAIVPEHAWKPADGINLEPAALEAVKSSENLTVIAGPGAGKTELLAQRASYLLQTGLCKNPRKILAISFKVDAADNLKRRVAARCGNELSRRFESRTYDSFAKQLVDQFRNSIYEEYQPTKDYRVLLTGGEFKSHIKQLETTISTMGINGDILMKRLAMVRLPIESVSESDRNLVLLRELWTMLPSGNELVGSSLTFGMITRLADFLVRTNRFIRNALIATYSYVFLDEFQDTTYIQYDLLKSIFQESTAILTAVGDDKQRIMGWAGALDHAFPTFQNDFAAQEKRLIRNYRSRPKLIQMQNILALDLDMESPSVSPPEDSDDDSGICEVWQFDDHVQEAEYLAEAMKNWLTPNGVLSPRDICVIVKQQEAIYAKELLNALNKVGIQGRIEKDYQEILAEECTQILVNTLTLAVRKRSPREWQAAVDLILFLNNRNNGQWSTIVQMDSDLRNFVTEIRTRLDSVTQCSDLLVLLHRIIDFYGKDRILASFPKYRGGNYFEELMQTFSSKLFESEMRYRDWGQALNDFKGDNSIPIMTIHKSKGLEYNTVVFVGLEDAAFWNFLKQSDEDKRAFFVAFSRAKERVVFTFCDEREIKRYNEVDIFPQSSQTISVLYQNLERAGVQIRNFRN